MSENGAAAQSGSHRLNPFARREDFSGQSILLYKITTLVSYIILLVTAFYYTFNAPHDGKYAHRTIWGNNLATPFAQNHIITSIYWIVLFILQLFYAYSLYSNNTVYVNAAANIGAHYIASNLLLFGFIHLWVRSHFWLALLLIVINFFNLTFAYFRHSTTPRPIHIGTVSGPLAWNFVALYWVGAVAVGSHHLAARIVANIFIWGFLAYGLFFLAAFKDYTIGFALSVGVPGLVGRDPFKRGEIVSEDRERAPLLADE
ncbi:hypothetical protein K491DRAFT_182755 [Lophiostoma macrostomum CBS 122681]|uniref:DUF1774-domain-containing protein n=1 Tax=Lophiostoma macrostomum CBS 122681 TaxID=1314788 RepID=A0A6A6TUD2_9PLEO|nr:hypothetical protein K491DRAFT_182755 [Lophiostoma macrostomum CBS 122681]